MTIKSQVLSCLSGCVRCRESDIHLTMHIWVKHYNSKVHSNEGRPYVYLSDIGGLPREDHVKRIRAKIQNEEHQYLPQNPEVRRKRSISESEWRQYLGYNQAERSMSGMLWGER